MKEVKIVSRSFTGSPGSALNGVPKYYSWKALQPGDGFDHPNDPIFFTDHELDKAKFFSCFRKIAWLIEPRAVIRDWSYQYVRSHLDEFDYVITYDDELANLGSPKIIFEIHGGCRLKREDIGLHPKSRFCSIVVSHKGRCEGHQLRHKIVEKCGDLIDAFGSGTDRPLPEKFDALKDYRFHLCVENSKQDTYFSEIPIDAMAAGCVPLYWGTEKIDQYFPKGVIPIGSAEECREKLLELKERPYGDFDEIALQNFERIQSMLLREDLFFEKYPFLFEVRPPLRGKRTRSSWWARLKKNEAEARKSDELEAKLERARYALKRKKAESERLRFQRDLVRDQRNEARAQRDELRKRLGEPLSEDKGDALDW